MLIIRFGLPEHGWLPVEMLVDGYVLQFDASDVPVNPLDELCSALILLVQGESVAVDWHLEPARNQFRFESKAQEIVLHIYEQEMAAYKFIGTFETVVLPFYRALKKTATSQHGANWPVTDSAKIEKLTKLIKARKGAH